MSPSRGSTSVTPRIAQVLVVLGQRGREDRGAGTRGELDGEAADAAGRADHEHRVALGERERVDGGEGGDPGQRSGAGRRDVDARGHTADRALRDGDELRPCAVAHAASSSRSAVEGG